MRQITPFPMHPLPVLPLQTYPDSPPPSPSVPISYDCTLSVAFVAYVHMNAFETMNDDDVADDSDDAATVG